MDDRIFSKRVYREIDIASGDPRPFFAVIQYNATHHPFLELPADLGDFGSGKPGRYHRAVVLLDRLLDELLRHLEARGVLDRTLVIITSDHGENLGDHDRHRTQSYYEEVLAIPLLVYLPEQLRRTRPEASAALWRNRTRYVQNLDLPPTLLDALGVLDRPEIARFVAAMRGLSLFREVPEERVIYALNNTAAYIWTNEGFSLVRQAEKYMFSERGSHEYYNLTRDPEERQNLWRSFRTPPVWVSAAIRADAAYERLLEQHTPRTDPLRITLRQQHSR
jgi:arylsulfatase A-like enzyme